MPVSHDPAATKAERPIPRGLGRFVAHGDARASPAHQRTPLARRR